MTHVGASLKKSDVNSFLRSSYERSDEGAAGGNSKLHNSTNKSPGDDRPSPHADRQRNKIQKKEFNLSPPMNVDPELVKKLAELTDKID